MFIKKNTLFCTYVKLFELSEELMQDVKFLDLGVVSRLLYPILSNKAYHAVGLSSRKPENFPSYIHFVPFFRFEQLGSLNKLLQIEKGFLSGTK